MATQTDSVEAVPSPGADASRSFALPFCVAGVGASAGGLEALKDLLSALAPDTGMAFMVVLHLPRDHQSMLSEILGRISPMPVVEVQDRVEVEPNHVYVLPAGSDLDIEDGMLRLRPREAAEGRHRPIDHYLHSLAEYQGEKAIGVVLSGTGSDGTLGIQEIKAAGGITFAQDDTAQQTGMPRSAIATGAVDFVLSPRHIAAELGRIARHPFVSAGGAEKEPPDIAAILDIVKDTIGVDFTHYKSNTLYRRIVRRIVLHKLGGIAEYTRMLDSSPAEVEALYQDILINVTSFFRNPEAFEALKSEVFPKLAENRSRHDPIRIWTLGCSTGEEAYSLAIAFSEFAESSGCALPLQVFATDLNGTSIEKARLGIYSRGAVEGIGSERVGRFFVETDGCYRIAKSVRDRCIFARHNVLSDPPFSRIDLVSCRNMLIYLGAEMQKRVIPILHYALRPNGWLWLGTSETIGPYRDLFDIHNTRFKIYSKRPVPGQVAVPVLAPAPPMPAPSAPRENHAERPLPALDSLKEIDRLLVSRYAPPSVLIRGDLEIVQYRGNTAPYLTPSPGRASLNLLKMVRYELVLGVRSALQRARSEEAPVRHEGARLSVDGVERTVAIEVIPVRAPGVQRADLFAVVFDDVTRQHELERAANSEPTESQRDESIEEVARLKQELSATREYLQSVIEQQEGANEELQSANEEVQSSNEELQSINEELQTSKEEIQSSNEELCTVNDELHARNAELAQTNNDLVNLLSSVQLGIVMVGPGMRVRRFTPLAEKLLNLIPTDIGRPISDIKTNLDVPDLHAMIAEVVDTMQPKQREVKDAEGRWYLIRIRPYRTAENRIEGAVIVLVDVDSLKRSEELLRQQTELLDQAHEPITMWELDGAVTYWNKAAEETFGFTREQALGRKCHELLHTSPPFASFAGELERDRKWTGELIQMRRDGQKIVVDSRMVMVQKPSGSRLVVEASRPITSRRESDQILRRLADDLVSADRNKDEFLAMLAHELRNPLAPLRAAVSLLQSPNAQAQEKERVVGIMDRQIDNMTRLIDDLLDVSRITLSQIELRMEPVDLAALARRAAEQSEPYRKPKQQTLHLNLPAHPVHVMGDSVRLEQIVGNLLHNASKYTPNGGNVWLNASQGSCEDGRSEVIISVKDDGIGIDPEKVHRVFDLFMRASRSIDQRHGGLGIGLTLVRRLVELHGGLVEARSDGRGLGSEFIVRLPLLRLDSEFAAKPGVAVPISSASRRVLVVDDMPDNAESMAVLLRALGHEIAIADSGAKALEMTPQFEPHVALIDIGMPEMNGYDVAKRLRGANRRAPRLVALSGYGDDQARQRARDAGFDDYLVKPASLTDLQRIIDDSAS